MISFLDNTDAIEYTSRKPSLRRLLHVVNCQGVMGSGIALQIKNKVPTAYSDYMYGHNNGMLNLGTISSGGFVVNLAAQDLYGREKRQLNYGALAQCLSQLVNASNQYEMVVPYLMGCDRAGGDWEVVSEMLGFYLGNFTVCKFGG